MPLYGNSYPLLAPDGTAAAPVYSFGSAPTTGLFASSGQLRISVAGTDTYRFGASQFQVLGSSAALGLNGDVILIRDAAANILALRNSTSAQTFRVYNTYDTGGTNYERAVFAYESNTLVIGTEQAGTGATRGLTFRMGGTNRWSISSSSHLLAVADNTYDIGASGANRPRNIYAGGNIQAAGFQVTGSGIAALGHNGSAITLGSGSWPTQLNGSAFLIGGGTDAFPAIVRDGAGIKITGAAGGLTSHIKVPAVAVGSLPSATTAGVGARAFVNDALSPVFGSAVANGGSAKVPVYSDGSAWYVG